MRQSFLPRSSLRPAAEILESRDCPAVIFQNDFSQDVNGFFTPARRNLLDFAEQQLSPYLQDDLEAIVPDPTIGNNWSFSFENTATRQNVVVANQTIPEDVIEVYAWGIPAGNFPSPGNLATCGPAAYSIQGSTGWTNTVIARGQAGRLITPATDTSVNVIRMDVNQDAQYYESTTPPSAGAAADLVTIFEHELLHPLGFLGSGNPATQRWINSAGQFTGPNVEALAGGPVQMEDGVHWLHGTTINGVPAVMDPNTTNERLTALDVALLKDVGWETNVPPPAPGSIGNDGTPDARDDIVDDAEGDFAVGEDSGGTFAQLSNPDGTTAFTTAPFPGFSGGIRTVAADFNGDGVLDLAVGTGPGVSNEVEVIDGRTQELLFTIHPFEASFTGGVFLAAGDLNSDGKAELIVCPDEGGGPRVQVYRGGDFALINDFYGIDDPSFRGGARPAIGDLNGDGKPDLLVAAGFGGGPRVTAWANADVLSGNIPNAHPLFNLFVFEQTLRNGVFVTAGDVNGDGVADLIVGAGPGGGPRVLVLDGKDLSSGQQVTLGNFFAGDVNSRGGVRVAARFLEDDGRSDVITGDGEGSGARVTAYDSATLSTGNPEPILGFDIVPGFTGGVFVG